MTTKNKTTLYYFYSTGCAFCKQVEPIVEKLNEEGYDILKLDLSEPDNDGLKREIENKYNLRCGTPWLINPDDGNNICGWRGEDIIRKWADGETIVEPPKPKSQAPPFPVENPNDDNLKIWTKKYDVWKKENNHLSNLQDAEQIIDRFKKQKETNDKRKNSLEGRLSMIENNLNKLMSHLGVK